MAARHVLVLGGARSGKTAFAERLALAAAARPAYLATAEALDEEMRARVLAHRRQRDHRFTTVEAPLALTPTIAAAARDSDVILVDCLTLWLSNLLGAGADPESRLEELATFLARFEAARVIVVSNEVGLGIVPDNALARRFRDLAGAAHQRLASVCADVYFVAAGLPLALKGGG